MRFALVSPYVGPNDGQGIVNAAIAAEALRRGHEVLVLAERTALPEAGDRLRCEELMPPAWLPTRLLRDQLLALRSRSALRRLAGDCDAVLANGFVSWAPADVNLVHFVHAAWVRSPWHPWRLRRDGRAAYALAYNRLNVALERGAFHRAGRIVAVSGQVRDDLLATGVPAERISVIGNGVDVAAFCPGPGERARFGLPAGVPVALFAGDLRLPRKNLDTLLAALPHVPGLHLAVAGRHEGTGHPEAARRLGLAGRVHFLGFVRDMPALMRSADLLAFPSRYEPCGLVVLEALASGLPVVTTRAAGATELLEGEAGTILEDSEDTAALAAALRRLAGLGAVRRAELGREARALAERHAWPCVARRHVDLLEASARARAGAPCAVAA